MQGRRLLLPATALVALAGGAAALRARERPHDTVRRPSVAEVRDRDIAFYQRRIDADPSGAIDLVRLGTLLLERFRQQGEEADLISAETAARRSLTNRSVRNVAALQLLQAALFGQHRFREARGAAEQVVALDPGQPAARASLGEVLLELGDYATADELFRPLTSQRYTLAVAPRYARWLELRGHAGAARSLLEWARRKVARSDPLPIEQLAWFELRLGELALRFGAYAEARRRLDAGLALLPDHWRLLAARARLALATGDYGTAVRLGDSSLTRHLDPATLAEVGDAWRARGDAAQAAEYYRAMEAASRAPRGGFHRGWYLALLDHDRRVPEILAAVQRDLETRRDVYGYDLLAWALYKSGRPGEAKAAIARALAWGSEDPLLQTHARAIEAAR
ncbi:MAG TPA: tetratricopeptide repeat protein [Gemmatimonadales bacterium]|nr:tetratricopeptide repeat protein [Gemmatimonadales bacterium]